MAASRPRDDAWPLGRLFARRTGEVQRGVDFEVDRTAAVGLLGEEVFDVGYSDFVDGDVFVVDAAAGADAAQARGQEQRDVFVGQARGDRAIGDADDVVGSVASFFDQLAVGGVGIWFTGVVAIADQSCREFDDRATDGGPGLFDEHQLAVIGDGDDADGPRRPDAFGVLPGPPAHQLQVSTAGDRRRRACVFVVGHAASVACACKVAVASAAVARRLSLDALRGIAVILMMEQHLGVWLWASQVNNRSILTAAPAYMAINGMGGMAAPLFITLAGVGCSLLVASRASPGLDSVLLRRGLVLLGCGYALNWLTPSWFSLGSWFVLHLMGAAIVGAPLWRRWSTPALLTGAAALLVATVVVQNWLETPFFIGNERMRNTALPGGAVRLAVAEGQFPLLPWLAMFWSGMAVGRWLQAGTERYIWYLLGGCVVAGGTLAGLGRVLDVSPAWSRALYLGPSFYPAHPVIILLLHSGVLVLVLAALRIEAHRELNPRGRLVCLGRASLTLLLVHVVVFREVSRPLGMWQAFDQITSLGIILAWLLLCTWLCRRWHGVGYRFGAEWLLRKLGG